MASVVVDEGDVDSQVVLAAYKAEFSFSGVFDMKNSFEATAMGSATKNVVSAAIFRKKKNLNSDDADDSRRNGLEKVRKISKHDKFARDDEQRKIVDLPHLPNSLKEHCQPPISQTARQQPAPNNSLTLAHGRPTSTSTITYTTTSVTIPVHPRPNIPFSPLSRPTRPSLPTLPQLSSASPLYSTQRQGSRLATVTMMESQEPTQVNDNRDYNATTDDEIARDLRKSFIDGDTGAVGFGANLNMMDDENYNDPLTSDPMSPVFDAGPSLSKGNWRTVQSSPQLNSLALGTTPFCRRPFGDPVTPMGNVNPFAHLQQSAMRPSQLFLASDPQIPSAMKEYSPTSSRPSPANFAPAPLMDLSSPSERRGGNMGDIPLLDTLPSSPIIGTQVLLGDRVSPGPDEMAIPESPPNDDRERRFSHLDARKPSQPRKLKRKSISVTMLEDESDVDCDSQTLRDHFGNKRRKGPAVDINRTRATSEGPAGRVSPPFSMQLVPKGGLKAADPIVIPESDEGSGVITGTQTSGGEVVIRASGEAPGRPLSQRQKTLQVKEAVPETSPVPTRRSSEESAVEVARSSGQPVPPTANDQTEEVPNEKSTLPASDTLMCEEAEQSKIVIPEKVDSDDLPLLPWLKAHPVKSPTISPLTDMGEEIPNTQISAKEHTTLSVAQSAPVAAKTKASHPQAATKRAPKGKKTETKQLYKSAEFVSSSILEPDPNDTVATINNETTVMPQSSEDEDIIESPKITPNSYTASHIPQHITPVPPRIPSGVLRTQIMDMDDRLLNIRPVRTRRKSVKLREAESKSRNASTEPTGTKGSPPRLPAQRKKGQANRIIHSKTPEPSLTEESTSPKPARKLSNNVSRMRTVSPASDRRLKTPLSEMTETPLLPGSPQNKKKRTLALSKGRNNLQVDIEATKSHPGSRKRVLRKMSLSRSTPMDSSDDELMMTPPEPEPESACLPLKSAGLPGRKTAKGWVYVPVDEDANPGLFMGMLFAIAFQSADLVASRAEFERRTEISRDIEHRILNAGGQMLSTSFEELFTKARPDGTLELTGTGKRMGFTVVIADEPSRKVKYMQALALGIPCVTYHWVDVCLRKGEVVDWVPYLLSSGASIVFGGAMMSRTLTRWKPKETSLEEMIGKRMRFLDRQVILFVKKKSREEEKKREKERFYLFLMHILGATVYRTYSVIEARNLLKEAEGQGEQFGWVYMDEGGEPEETGRGKGRRKKRESGQDEDMTFTGVISGVKGVQVRGMSSELVVQSLIRGGLIEEEIWEGIGNSGSGGRKR